MNPPPIPNSPQLESDGHLGNFLVSTFGVFVERFLFYGLRAMLVVMLLATMGDGTAIETYAAYGSLGYISVMLMGLVGDLFLERRISGMIGTALIGIGYIVLHVSISMHWGNPIVGLAIAAVGTGLFRTANVVLMFNSFPYQSRGMVPVYLYYATVNFGAFVAPFILGGAFPAFMERWGALVIGGLALLWSLFLFLAYFMGWTPPETERQRSKSTKLLLSPVLGIVSIACCTLALGLLGYGLIEWSPRWMPVILQVIFVVIAVASLVLVMVFGRASMLSVMVLLAVGAAQLLFWSSFEGLYGQMYRFSGDFSGDFMAMTRTNLTITMLGTLFLGAIMIAPSLRGRLALALPGSIGTGAWILAMALIFVFGFVTSVFTESYASIRNLFILLSVIEILLIPALYYWVYRSLPGPFRSAGLGLIFGLSFLAHPLAGLISKVDNPELGWEALRSIAIDFIPWFGVVLLLLIAATVLSWILPGKSSVR